MRAFIILFIIITLTFATNLEYLNLPPFLFHLNERNGLVYNWFYLGVFSLTIASLATILLFLISKIVDNPQLSAKVKTEIHEILFTLLLLIILQMFLTTFDAIVPHLTNQDNVIDYIKLKFETYESYFLPQFTSILSTYYSSMSKSGLSGGVSIDRAKYFNPSVSYKYPRGVGQIIYSQQLWRFYTKYAMLFFVLKKGIYLVMDLVGPFMIGLGALLRCYSPTRRIGSTLIGVGIMFAYGLPLILFMFYFPSNSNVMPNSEDQTTCPSICSEKIYGFSDDGDLITNLNINEFKQQDKLNDFVLGNIDKITLNGKTYYSCEALSNKAGQEVSNSLSPIFKQKMERISNNLFQCPTMCRQIPYPSDNSICRLEEQICNNMFHSHNDLGKLCFRKLYNFSKLNEEITTIDGQMELREKLLRNCYTILPLDVPDQPISYFCASECRGYTKEGNPLCKDNSYGEYNIDYFDLKPEGGCNYRNVNYIVNDVKNALETGNYDRIKKELYNLNFPIGTCEETFPPTIDCNSCLSKLVSTSDSQSTYIKISIADTLLNTIVLPTVALSITLFAGAGLSQFLGGEMFVPGYNKV